MSKTVPIAVVRFETNDSDNYRQAAFADRDGKPDTYIILQRAIVPDEQDEELGLAGCYVESSDPRVVGYDLCEQLLWDGRTLAIRFKGQRHDSSSEN